jgi:hypothetical protein
MEKGDFDAVTQEFIDRAYAEQGDSGFMGTGLQVKPVDTNVIDFKLWYRGKVTTEVKYKTWRTWFKEKTQVFHTFDRLVIMFRRRPTEVVRIWRIEL